jgi:hypothetical protein
MMTTMPAANSWRMIRMALPAPGRGRGSEEEKRGEEKRGVRKRKGRKRKERVKLKRGEGGQQQGKG